jgi:predicted nucleic acid-binding protein
VAEFFSKFVALPRHVFWPDDVSILDRQRFEISRIATPKQITDCYLLALAIAHRGQLVTLDRRLIPDAVLGGAQGLHLIR